MNEPEVMIDAEAIRRKIGEMAERISNDYRGNPVHMVILLRGAMIFAADLMRALDLDVRLDFMVVKSYVGQVSGGEVKILKFIDTDISGRHVLIVEDIIDTGLTLSRIQRELAGQKPASLEICTLLDKPSRRKAEVNAKYVGFTIEDKFVVGYGLDYNERHRSLPYVGVLNPE